MEPRVFTRGNRSERWWNDEAMIASMEPRVFTRGNQLLLLKAINKRMLQWSHASSRVETSSRTEILRQALTASMEPRVFTRGNMFYGRAKEVGAKALQWSHASSR